MKKQLTFLLLLISVCVLSADYTISNKTVVQTATEGTLSTKITPADSLSWETSKAHFSLNKFLKIKGDTAATNSYVRKKVSAQYVLLSSQSILDNLYRGFGYTNAASSLFINGTKIMSVIAIAGTNSSLERSFQIATTLGPKIYTRYYISDWSTWISSDKDVLDSLLLHYTKEQTLNIIHDSIQANLTDTSLLVHKTGYQNESITGVKTFKSNTIFDCDRIISNVDGHTDLGDGSHHFGTLYATDIQLRDGLSSQFIKADGSLDGSTYVDTLSEQTITGLKHFNAGLQVNKTLLYSPDVSTDVFNVRRYGSDYSVFNLWSPPQTSWAGAKEATISIVRGDSNQYFMDLYNMDYGTVSRGDYLHYGNPQMGLRLQKRYTGEYVPFAFEYSNGNYVQNAMTIHPNGTDSLNNRTYVSMRKLNVDSVDANVLNVYRIYNKYKNSSPFIQIDSARFEINRPETGLTAIVSDIGYNAINDSKGDYSIVATDSTTNFQRADTLVQRIRKDSVIFYKQPYSYISYTNSEDSTYMINDSILSKEQLNPFLSSKRYASLNYINYFNNPNYFQSIYTYGIYPRTNNYWSLGATDNYYNRVYAGGLTAPGTSCSISAGINGGSASTMYLQINGTPKVKINTDSIVLYNTTRLSKLTTSGIVTNTSNGILGTTTDYATLSTNQTFSGAKAFSNGAIFYGNSGLLPTGLGAYLSLYNSSTYGLRLLGYDGINYRNFTIGPRIGSTGSVFAQYVDSTGYVKFNGGYVKANQLAVNIQTLTDATTIAWSLTSGANATITLTDAVTSRTLNVSGGVAGSECRIIITQSANATYPAVSWGTMFKFPNDTAPVLNTNANGVTMLEFFFDGTYYRLRNVVTYNS